MADEAESKTEKATPKKRRDERKEGHVFISKDVVSLAVVLISFYSIKLLFPYIYRTNRSFMEDLIHIGGSASLDVDLRQLGFTFMTTMMKCVLPLLIICCMAGVVATGAQTKFLFSGKSAKPKWNRLSPIQGIKRMFSLRNVVELLKNILKVIILVWVMKSLITDDIVSVIRTMDMDIKQSTAYMLDMVIDMVFRVVIIFTAIAVFDYFYQWWQYERDMKMSKEELKEEFKQTEGNPEIKGRIKSLQQEMAQRRMMQDVQDADVIIKNPTHFAVALKYDINVDRAPYVVAKGQDYLALRIIALGEKSGVSVIENRPLARGLYRDVKVGGEIPEEFYSAVADVLVYIMNIDKKAD